MRILSFYLLCLLVSMPSFARADQSARVMIVHSYEADHICGQPQGQGVVQALAANGWKQNENLILKSFYMNTKKVHTTPEAIRARARKGLDAIEAFKPDVVVVLDDNAIREVMLPLVGRDDLSVVFSGMNGQPSIYNSKTPFIETADHPGSNVTGVYEKLYLAKSLAVIGSSLNGFAKGDKVVGITDYSPTGNAISRQFELEIAAEKTHVDWELHRVNNFDEYRTLIHALNEDPKVRAIYPAALSLQTADGGTYTAPEIFAWTIRNSRKPEMSLNYFFSKIGLFGGAAVDFTAMGRMAGDKVARILNGEKAGALPIEDARDYAIVFNQRRARQLNIAIPPPLLTAADHVYR